MKLKPEFDRAKLFSAFRTQIQANANKFSDNLAWAIQYKGIFLMM